MTGTRSVTSRAHGKINLYLGVGKAREDGYHELATVFQSVSLTETLTVAAAEEDSVTITGPFSARDIPLDASNLALRAAHLLAEEARTRWPHAEAGPVQITIDKQVPVAGGMGGGSADAAASLTACAALWDVPASRGELLELASRLGADVPFALTGGTALGTGIGDQITPALTRGTFHWVIATSKGELSTPEVYGRLDELRAKRSVDEPAIPAELIRALADGDPHALAEHLHNDLAEAALDLVPALRPALTAGRDAGALAGLVSGSGPTLAFLVADPTHALELAVLLSATPGIDHVIRTTSTRPSDRKH